MSPASPEARDKQARAASLGDPSEAEQYDQRQAQVERPSASLALASEGQDGRQATHQTGREKDRDHAGRDQDSAPSDSAGVPRTQHERNSQRRDHVRDRYLSDHRQHRIALQSPLLGHGKDHGRRTRGEQDGVDRRVPDATDQRDEEPGADRTGAHDRGCAGTAVQRCEHACLA